MAHTDHRSGLHRLPTQPPPCATRAELDAVTDAIEALDDSSTAQADAIEALQRELRDVHRLHWGERRMDGDAGMVARVRRVEWWISAIRWSVGIVLAATLAVFGTCAGQRLAGEKVGAVDAEGSGSIAGR